MEIDIMTAKKYAQSLFPDICQVRPKDAHKGIFGTVAVIGGAKGMSGALVLASVAALKTGCGKVIAGFEQESIPVPYFPENPEIMLQNAKELMQYKNIDAWVIGCGLGKSSDVVLLLEKILFSSQHSPILLDADALNILAEYSDKDVFRLPENVHRILTPHPLEAARLLHCTVEEINHHRKQSALQLAKRYRSWVVLKGHRTVVASPNLQEIWTSPVGSSVLATAGSGDVLSGVIGSLLAQKIAISQAVRGGVWLHAQAGENLIKKGISIGATASEIANEVRFVRHQLIVG
ncbi:MAG: NAD(P)H-hydrate dehydratase [Neisseriaceae bacterium]|nr:NAD(P)H-hydrate dehydratase [Neisseriaceae bacterium]